MIASDGANVTFLIGAPRSGTTLLSSILGKVPGVLCPPELWIALPIVRLLRSLPALHHDASDSALAALAIREAFGPQTLQRLASAALVSAYEALLSRRPGVQALVDKTPRYYKVAPILAELLPKARFVLISRNPLDVAASHKERWQIDLLSLGSPAGLCDTSFDVLVAPARITQLRDQLGERAHWIRYEDLAQHPTGQVRALCEFLGFAFTPKILDYRRDNPAAADLAHSSFGDPEVWRREAIDTTSIDYWHSILTDAEVDLVCGALGPSCFAELGYLCPRPGLDNVALREDLDAALEASLVGPGGAATLRDAEEVAVLRRHLVRAERAREAAEADRERWEALCREAERERETERDAREREETAKRSWLERCREAEADRDAAHQSRRREADAREHWERLCREAESDRDAAHEARRREADAREHWERLCREAEQQRDHWRQLCREAEAGRDSEYQARLGEAEAHASWRRLCNEAEAQRDHLVAWRERLSTLWPWMEAVADTETSSCPRISVVTPSFNQARWIGATIESLLAQKYPNFEHIVVDGGSTDGTADLVARYPHVRFLSEPDLGQAHAINKGMLLATGSILAYLNSDDVYRAGAFDVAAEVLGAPDGPDVLVGDCDYIDEQGEATGHLRARLDHPRDLLRYWGWGRLHCVPQQAVFWRRQVLSEVGLFDPGLQYTMDYEMWLRMIRPGRYVVLNKTLAAFRMQAESKTLSSTWRMYLEERISGRRHWPRWSHPVRWQLEVASARHLGRKLLDVAEHEALANRLRRHPLRLLGMALLRWPPLVVDPRTLLTATSAISAGGFARRMSEPLHRGYLHALWRLRRARSRPG